MRRKVFISVLGTGFYENCSYVNDTYKSEKVRYIQEASLLESGAENWTSGDVAFILLTESAKKYNWDENITEKFNFREQSKVPYEGLEKRLKDLKLPISIEAVDIPDGKNDKEMWDIFDILFNKIKEGDELYFDLTHSFRYLPMLVLIFGNYAKFLKAASVKKISYGNWEARNQETNEAPIIDLMPIAALQDWTFAAADFLKNGNCDRLTDLSKTALAPVLREAKGTDLEASALKSFMIALNEFTNEKVTCRGINIVESKTVRKLKKISGDLNQTFIKPLNPVFDKIKDSLNEFDENENVMNGFNSAKWCLDNGLYQQAVTLAYECLTTYICIKEDLDWRIEKERDIISKVFKIVAENISEENWKLGTSENADEEEINFMKIRLRSLSTSEYIRDFIGIYKKINPLRNDFNHAGFKNNAMKYDKMKDAITPILNDIFSVIEKHAEKN